MEMDTVYPPAPARVPPGITEPSASFRAEVRNVALTIVAFVLVYLLMVALAAGLLWLCWHAGIFIILNVRNIWAILLGAGLILMGVLVVFFLLKFLFDTSDDTGDTGIELTEADDPRLFAFVRQVAKEVGTHFPKKIFLQPDVNASVFYSSSFWSLFFPTRKNLNIGLGLVNSMNLGEFKAVLAHEFGHFSQRSMRLGSYVYYVNQVIFNMLYRNDGWASAANNIAGIHQVLGAMVQVAVYIVQGIQWVLRGMYAIVNRRYLSLSRQMEFHADTIAATVSGSNNMTQALRQLDLGHAAYQSTLEKCQELLGKRAMPHNFFAGQQANASLVADFHDLPVQAGVPIVTPAFAENRRLQRVVFQDQWASHPTTAEREAHLKSLGLEAPVVPQPAWQAFEHPSLWQNDLTEYIYRSVEEELDPLEDDEFAKTIQEEIRSQQLPKVFAGYFDSHLIAEADWAEMEREVPPKAMTDKAFHALFGENFDLKIQACQNDIEVLDAIAEGRIDTNSFDFDGHKYGKDRASEIRKQLEQEIARLEAERDQRDREIARVFFAHAQATHPGQVVRLRQVYEELYEASRWKREALPPAISIIHIVHALRLNDFHVSTELAQPFRDLHTSLEPALRSFFQKLPMLDAFDPELQTKIRELFLRETITYQQHYKPIQENLEKLQIAAMEIGNVLSSLYFTRLKTVLDMQVVLLEDLRKTT